MLAHHIFLLLWWEVKSCVHKLTKSYAVHFFWKPILCSPLTSDILLLSGNWISATWCDRAAKCDLCCKGLIGSISSVSRPHNSDFSDISKNHGRYRLGLKRRRLLSDNLSLSRASFARRADLLLWQTAFLFGNIDLHVSAEQCLHGNFFTKRERGKKQRCRVDWDELIKPFLTDSLSHFIIKSKNTVSQNMEHDTKCLCIFLTTVQLCGSSDSSAAQSWTSKQLVFTCKNSEIHVYRNRFTISKISG